MKKIYTVGNVEVEASGSHSPSRLKVLNYLLTKFAPKSVNKIEIKFIRRDYVTMNADADYTGYNSKPTGGKNHWGYIRLSVGSDTLKDCTNNLFHEYKHLLQDDEGYFERPDFDHCKEAQAWADIQEPIYKESLNAN